MKLSTMAFAALASIAFATSAFAEDLYGSQKLFQFTNDRDSGLGIIDMLTTAQGAADGLRYTRTGNASRGARLEFSVAQLNSGAVLESQQGINALVVKGPIDINQGGTVTFTYVANGLTGSYESCQADLRRGSGGAWVLYNKSTHAPIQTAKIVTWSMGISTLEGICN